MSELVVVQRRGAAVEAEHPVSAVLCDSSGRVLDRAGAPLRTTWRSSAKPFQLEGSLSLLPAAVAQALEDRDLALGTSSHSGEPAHVARLEGLMERLGIHEDLLGCGPVWPFGASAAEAAMLAGGARRDLYNDCSGKHVFMCAATWHQGWPADYRRPDHPVQQRILEGVRRWSAEEPEVVVDACGVPCFVLSLDGMARAWAGLGDAMHRGEGSVGRIGRAMKREWWWASGTHRVDGTLMEHTPLVAKIGAAALLCVAWPQQGLGLAMKVRSGASSVRAPAITALLQRWLPGLLPEGLLAEWSLVRSDVGEVVGDHQPRWSREGDGS